MAKRAGPISPEVVRQAIENQVAAILDGIFHNPQYPPHRDGQHERGGRGEKQCAERRRDPPFVAQSVGNKRPQRAERRFRVMRNNG